MKPELITLMTSLSMIIGLIGGLIGIIGGCLGIWTSVSINRKENKMWQIYFSLLPDLKEGKTWDPESPEEIKFAEQMAEKSILKRSPISGYQKPEAPEVI
ncbi:hypothetical protein MNBD_NITROSPIRAE03-1230 [hydrothermal vent metagenome]|uniref:Uncharacterized protein n=1 Tax=hydrothermal vent metagenome TaxID=652676 RepID=A0A3B1DI05_9ZZZZ